jgi:hypothetical protein
MLVVIVMSNFVSNKYFRLVEICQSGLKGNITVGREGKPLVPSSPPSQGLISMAVV